ncbi:hypothetical protein QN277_001191 [Acacia crassicarpa]|uniref:Uncharacterized protein n=1 Tax=Acacia crassicarpa TaxID=499986 RepID=A0AAE1TI20_9FABA|nr:hypothetical protein QN277_001191 [Acacia crassicarpa]
MSSLQISILPPPSQKRVHAYAAIDAPRLPRVRISLPTKPSSSIRLVQVFDGSMQTTVPSEKDVTSTSQTTFQDFCDPNKSKANVQLYATLKTIAQSVEMNKNIRERNNRNRLLLMNSLDKMMVHLKTAIHNTLLKLTSTLLLIASKGMLLIKNKIETSKRKATRLFKKLQTVIQTTFTVANPTNGEDVNSAMKKSKFEPRNNDNQMKVLKSQKEKNNGWSPELENEMRQILEVVKRKEIEKYGTRGNLALKITKTFAILGPLLAGIAALGSAFARHGSSWAGVVAVVAASLSDSMDALEGMVLEIYKNCGEFLQDAIEITLEEKDFEKRENGELFEKKVARKLGRSVSQLRQLASKFAARYSEGIAVDELHTGSSDSCT